METRKIRFTSSFILHPFPSRGRRRPAKFQRTSRRSGLNNRTLPPYDGNASINIQSISECPLSRPNAREMACKLLSRRGLTIRLDQLTRKFRTPAERSTARRVGARGLQEARAVAVGRVPTRRPEARNMRAKTPVRREIACKIPKNSNPGRSSGIGDFQSSPFCALTAKSVDSVD